MSEPQMTLRAFKVANPEFYHLARPLFGWVIIHLVLDFDPGRALTRVKKFIDNDSVKEARYAILEDLVRQYSNPIHGRINPDRWQMAIFYLEGAVVWYLKHGLPLDAHKEPLWQQIHAIFDPDKKNGPRPSDTRGESVDTKEYGQEPAAGEAQSGNLIGELSDLEEDDEIGGTEPGTPNLHGLSSKVKRNITKEKFLDNFDAGLTELPRRNPVDPVHLLRHVASIAGGEFPRYKALFDSVGLESIIETLGQSLNPGVQSMCMRADFSVDGFENVSENSRDPTTLDAAGVYLHVLWEKDKRKIFWLYVGQSVCLQKRIRDHRSRRRQNMHSCLHYHIWNSHPEKESLFVNLYTGEMPMSADRQLMLNLAEMWLCCLLQTLTGVQLDKYLPEDVDKPWAGRHLNIASPLWQSFTESPEEQMDSLEGRRGFTALLTSEDPNLRRWAEEARESFNYLRNSPDAELREYYRQQIRHSTRLASETLSTLSREQYRDYLLGKERPVKVNVMTTNGIQRTSNTVVCGWYYFTIHKEHGLQLQDGDQVSIQFHLAKGPEHPAKYMPHTTQPTDPAHRFAVSISGEDIRGQFHVWLRSKSRSQKTVSRINSLVDTLEGYTLEESKRFKKRWFAEKVDGKRRMIYT